MPCLGVQEILESRKCPGSPAHENSSDREGPQDGSRSPMRAPPPPVARLLRRLLLLNCLQVCKLWSNEEFM